MAAAGGKWLESQSRRWNMNKREPGKDWSRSRTLNDTCTEESWHRMAKWSALEPSAESSRVGESS